eukprot:XP_011666854.1 PREDICTED: uncharacterized protein LOC100892389 [Strongylocentrotus purpuratus]
MIMDWPRRRVDLLLFCVSLILSLPVGGRTCITASSTTSTSECATQPTHMCHVTTQYEDVVLSNHTVWACISNGLTSLHCTPNCCASDNLIDGVINLTRGARTEIDCLKTSTNPTNPYVHKLEIHGPPGSQVLMAVSNGDARNVITVTDAEDSDDVYIFNVNSFVTDDDYFLSSSNVVYLHGTFTNSGQGQNVVIISQAFDIIDTIMATTPPQQCTVSPLATGDNQWHTRAECEDGMHSFNKSCYQFSTANANLATARINCEAMGYHLVYIESSEEQGFLESMVNGIVPLPKEQWIGIERTAQGERVWMDGSTITYSNFRAGEAREECFQIRQQDAYEWRDHDCGHKHAYICEREQGYNGLNPSDGGCVASSGTLPTNINNEGAILLKFGYTIKTTQVFQTTGRTRTTSVFTGHCITACLPRKAPFLYQNGLEVDVSCGSTSTSSGSWAVTFQARGTGMFEINAVQLLIYNRTEPPTIRPMYVTSTTMPHTAPSATTSQNSTAIDPDISAVTIPQTTSPTSLLTSSLTTTNTTTQGNGKSTGVNSALTITVALLLIFILIIVIIGVTCFVRRRRLSSVDQNSQPQNSEAYVKNSAFDKENNEQHDYTTCIHSVKSSSKQVDHSEVLDDVNQHEYTELPCDRAPKPDNLVIYSEVGEEEYNVLFGGKMRGDYHEYNLPDSDQGTAVPAERSHVDGTNPQRKRSLINGTEQRSEDYNVPFDGQERGDYHEYNLPNSDEVKPGTAVPDERLQEGGSRHILNGTLISVSKKTSLDTDHALPMLQKPGDHAEAGDNAYQHLHTTDDGSYTPLTKTGQSSPGDNGSLHESSIPKKCIKDEFSDGKSKITSEYNDPISKTDEESYDCLQRASLTGAQRNTTKDAVHVDENDYLTPNAGNTYQTLANPEAQPENSGDKILDYSHLERDLKTNPLPDPTISSNESNQYEKLNLH